MNQIELDALSQWGTLKTKVYFILQLAYFKAKNQFFTFDFDETRADVEYVLTHFFKRPIRFCAAASHVNGCVSKNK